MAILAKQKKLEISNGNQLKKIVEKNVAINFIIMKLKDFIYLNKCFGQRFAQNSQVE
jgi:hypothetical protein